ncbi:hypothetical protein [Sphingomonas sp. MA1305]|uniref:hypothetical protein n=1 Tax=Sphingomonas sp. MA1305 TaxID=2479204 RepID=UPI0018DF8B85|nr:hypothetical protein [Sphingomonas sp. MA1305]
MTEGEELDDQECALVGRIILSVAAAESVVSKIWWHFSFVAGETLEPERCQKRPMSEKLQALRKLIPQDGRRTDQQLSLIIEAFSYIEDDRHALVHGYPAVTVEGGVVLNLRQNYHVWAGDLPPLCDWARHLRHVSFQMYVDATRGIYEAETAMPPLEPLPVPPGKFARKAPLIPPR